MYVIGSYHKLLYMSWYTNMKPFHTNLKLVIENYLYAMHDPFPGVEYYYDDLIIGEISN